ncbi:MAG: hypothetical protein EKK62_17325 [Acidimicrobiia bacterium]|nr:MAG: hypothetical protein EKK62_17325 [Acidimicrobiia bacterium]
MAALASPSDLGELLQLSIDEDDARAVLVIRMASAAVCRVAGSVSDAWEIGDVPEVAWTVTLAAAARLWVNPAGQTDRSVGPFRDSWASDSTAILTADEREQIAALNTSSIAGLSSIRLQAPWRAAGSRWYDEEYDELVEADSE